MSAATGRVRDFPVWLRFIDSVLPVTSLFIVHGNIRDLHLVPRGDGSGFQPTAAAIRDALERSGMPTVLYFSALHGLGALPGSDEQAARRALGDGAELLGNRPSLAQLGEIALRISQHREDPVALVIDYLSQTAVSGAEPGGDADPQPLYLALLRIANEAGVHVRQGAPRERLHNPVFVLVDAPGGLPPWLVSGDGIRQVPIAVPDLAVRTRAARVVVPALLRGAPASDAERAGIEERFRDATHGLSLRSLVDIVQLSADASIPADRIEDAVRRYRVGFVEDPWRAPELVDKLRTGQERLEARVKGQPRAIRHALDILVRSASGMTAAHRRDRGTGPRGVLFFAGPTGVGKTELAKSIAALLFGDDEAYVRFDMSEFAEDAADNRLIGSPPGYVGHGHGGELTNAVRERPFSVLLFDEIEKAHPRILDKFLQILSDGRLTDGSGDTVFFNEALIVFTSNLGMGEPGTLAADALADEPAYERAVQEAIGEAFTARLNRPELLGRIGDNIVVFDYITPAIAREIADGYIENVLRRVAREQRVTVTLPDEVRADVLDRSIADLSKGARGVGNNLETAFVNPLARAVFGVPADATRIVAAVTEDSGGMVTVALS